MRECIINHSIVGHYKSTWDIRRKCQTMSFASWIVFFWAGKSPASDVERKHSSSDADKTNLESVPVMYDQTCVWCPTSIAELLKPQRTSASLFSARDAFWYFPMLFFNQFEIHEDDWRNQRERKYIVDLCVKYRWSRSMDLENRRLPASPSRFTRSLDDDHDDSTLQISSCASNVLVFHIDVHRRIYPSLIHVLGLVSRRSSRHRSPANPRVCLLLFIRSWHWLHLASTSRSIEHRSHLDAPSTKTSSPSENISTRAGADLSDLEFVFALRYSLSFVHLLRLEHHLWSSLSDLFSSTSMVSFRVALLSSLLPSDSLCHLCLLLRMDLLQSLSLSTYRSKDDRSPSTEATTTILLGLSPV